MKTILISRKQPYLAKFGIFFITVALIAGMVGCTDHSENLDIKDWNDLNKLRKPEYRYGDHKLVSNLDADTPGYKDLASSEADEGKGWVPIGDSITPFKGSLDGQGYTIEDLFINRPGESDVGLFGSIAESAVIENVEVANVTVTGSWRVGALVGKNEFEGTVSSTISNCSSSGSVSGHMYVGGLVGENEKGTVSVSHFTGSVTSEEGSYIGGLVGKNDGGTVSSSNFTGSVMGNENVGGLVGWNDGTVSNSYSTSSVRGNGNVGGLVGENVGGLVGENEKGTVSDSHSTGSVRGNENVGGLVGFNNGTVSTVNNSSSSSKVTGSNEHVGGLVGWNDGTVSNSYSTGSVMGNDNVGGLVGINYGGTVSDSHSKGSVTSEEGSYIGGLVGINYGGTVSDSHSSGSVTGDENVGGLVGFNINRGTVSKSYSTGNVTGDDGVGGLVGRNYDGTVSNSHYNYDEVHINNNQRVITIGALYAEDFEEWLAKDKFLDINERLSEKDGYYLVSNVTAFKQLMAFGQNETLNFRLTKDLYLGDDEHNFYIPYLAKKFDGDGHKIWNLSLDLDFVCNVGLFGYLARGGRVTQVGVEDVDITGASSVGGLVGDNNGIVSNSYSSGSVTADNYVGGLVGHNYMQGKLSNSYSNGIVIGNTDVGGLVGNNIGTVSDSQSTGSVTGNADVGGLVGNNIGTVSSSNSTGSVTGNADVGGLVGRNQGTVEKSYYTGSVNEGLYQYGDVVGGLVGRNEDTVRNSYSTGSVSGNDWVGGLVGRNSGTVIDSYSTGSVFGDEYVGSLVGRNSGTVIDSFWDEENSGMTDGVGTGNDAGITGKSEQEMKDIETYRLTGWDIVKIEDYTDETWYIDDKKDYPRLGWQL
jgi:hypothetical protein